MAPDGQGGTAAAALPHTLIDMHCHVFNASDLPATTFLFRVATERHSDTPDINAALIGMIVSLLAGNAPTAAEELADIKAGRTTKNGAAAAAAITSGKVSGLLDWLNLFGRPRRDLVRRLAHFYEATNNDCALLAPALVDYDFWLDNPEKDGQRLTDQVAVMGEIAKLPGRTRVHGFVGYDPIRAIMGPTIFNPGAGTARETIKPLDLLKEAVTKHGFLGVKLYPPMGFRAWQNGNGDLTFSEVVKTYVRLGFENVTDRNLGKMIDTELEKLYRYCAEEGVPILAHAYNSNQAEECTGWRASPQYWGEVVEQFSTPEKPLRLCLGHFGSFSAHTKFPTCADAFGAKAWEIIIGTMLASPKASHVFADVSYLSEVIDRSNGWQARLASIRDQFRSFIGKFDTSAEHICYGSDWLMLGREAGHERYHVALGEFLRNDVGLNQAQLNNIYFGNAVRFLGLQPGDQNRARLEKFYRDNGIEQHFPRVDALVG